MIHRGHDVNAADPGQQAEHLLRLVCSQRGAIYVVDDEEEHSRLYDNAHTRISNSVNVCLLRTHNNHRNTVQTNAPTQQLTVGFELFANETTLFEGRAKRPLLAQRVLYYGAQYVLHRDAGEVAVDDDAVVTSQCCRTEVFHELPLRAQAVKEQVEVVPAIDLDNRRVSIRITNI